MEIRGARRRGFTLVELIIILAIVSMLGLLVFFSLHKARQKAKLARVSAELSSIATAVTQYYQDNNYTYPPDADRDVPPGLERYLASGTWPKSAWPHGVYDWDNWVHPGPDPEKIGKPIYQISYRLCGVTDPEEYCRDSVLFPQFTRYSAIYYCVAGPCVPHISAPTDPGYCVNCKPKEQNYTP
jgi:prepilin-type N-terminal cleavage/methylation domain-containing protein